VNSKLNWVNIYTKPLSKIKHESLRKFSMGWSSSSHDTLSHKADLMN